jgi:hypothetical protein
VRELFSYRFWATLGALLLAIVVLQWVLPDTSSSNGSVTADGVARHRVDLVAPMLDVVVSPGFALGFDGLTTADMAIVLDAQRTMLVTAGTKGEIDCPSMLLENPTGVGCTVAADLLGDAVLWFAIVESENAASLVLPATRELLDDGYVLLANGWELRHAYRVERRCAEDTQSLRAFIARFGDYATTTFDIETQRVVRVTCLGEPPATTVDESVPDSGPPPTGGSAPSDTAVGTGEG